MTVMVRTMLQVDASDELKQAVSILAIQNRTSVKALVLNALAVAYPELKPLVEEAKKPSPK